MHYKNYSRIFKNNRFNIYRNSKEYKWFKIIFFVSLLLVILGFFAKRIDCIKDFFPELDLIIGFSFAIIVNYLFYIRTILTENDKKDLLLTEIVWKIHYILQRSIFVIELMDNYITDENKSIWIKIEREIMADNLYEIKILLLNNFPSIFFEISGQFSIIAVAEKNNAMIKQEKLFFDEVFKLKKKFNKIFYHDDELAKILNEYEYNCVDTLKDVWIFKYPEADFETIVSKVKQKLFF